MGYTFVQFDPRPQGADGNNGIIAAAHEGRDLLGIEVTIPALAAQCGLGNLDHHGSGSTAETPSAIEQALTAALPPDGATLATIRADADSVGAMAVLALRLQGEWPDSSSGLGAETGHNCGRCGWDHEAGTFCVNLVSGHELVSAIGRMDRLGPAAGERDPRVVAIARKAADFKSPLEARVAWVQSILLGTHDQAEILRLVAERDRELEEARKASSVRLAGDGKIAVVTSAQRFAMNLGYEMATIVVATNPEFPLDPRNLGAGNGVKHTVARFDSHVPLNIAGVLAELRALEPGWGGGADIIGSTQGASSPLTTEQVVEVVARHLK